MTANDHTTGRGGCGADAGAYVLGALEGEEAQAFRRHLAICVVCRDEVAALQTAVNALPMAVPQLPTPRRLRRRVMSSIRAEPKTTMRGPGRRRLRPAYARPALALAATLIIAAAIAGGLELSGESGGVRLVHASVTAPSASAVVRLASGRAELTVRHLPAPPSGKIYEVWLKRDGAAPSPTSALFSVNSAGSGAAAVPGDLHGVDEVLVTPEPLGGSAAPTHTPVILARLS